MASVCPLGASTVTFNCAAWRYILPRESLTVNTSPDLPARIQTAIQFPPVLFALNASDVLFVDPASLLALCISVILPARAPESGESSATASTKESKNNLAGLCPTLQVPHWT